MKKWNMFWGLLLILAAVLIVANQFGLFTDISMFEVVAAIILGGIIIRSIMSINFWGILFPAAFLCILFADELKITDFTPWPALLTALLFSIGLSLIFKRPYFWGNFSHSNNVFGNSVVDEQDGNVINSSTTFGESIKYVNTENFEKANIKCSFGDVKMYFDHANIPSGKADIYLDVSFGDAQLFLPRSWKVINNMHVFLGDMNEVNRDKNTESPIVTLRGYVNFGDCKIIYI